MKNNQMLKQIKRYNSESFLFLSILFQNLFDFLKI